MARRGCVDRRRVARPGERDAAEGIAAAAAVALRRARRGRDIEGIHGHFAL
jgi:hypothetical protein